MKTSMPIGVTSINLKDSLSYASSFLRAVSNILGTISFILLRQRLQDWMAISFTVLKFSTKTAL